MGNTITVKKIFYSLIEIPNSICNLIILKYRNVKYGRDFKIKGRIFCVSNSVDGIVVGDNVSINSCRKANPIGGDKKTILFAKEKEKIRIGSNVGISNATIFPCENVTIEDDVLIGGNVKIYDTNFHWLD